MREMLGPAFVSRSQLDVFHQIPLYPTQGFLLLSRRSLSRRRKHQRFFSFLQSLSREEENTNGLCFFSNGTRSPPYLIILVLVVALVVPGRVQRGGQLRRGRTHAAQTLAHACVNSNADWSTYLHTMNVGPLKQNDETMTRMRKIYKYIILSMKNSELENDRKPKEKPVQTNERTNEYANKRNGMAHRPAPTRDESTRRRAWRRPRRWSRTAARERACRSHCRARRPTRSDRWPLRRPMVGRERMNRREKHELSQTFSTLFL